MDYSTWYLVTYQHGLMNPTVVYASDPISAKKMGLAEYRLNSTALDFFSADDVVAEVKLVAGDQE